MTVQSVAEIAALTDRVRQSFQLHIKHMISQRCILQVKEVLSEVHLVPKEITLGTVVLQANISDALREQIRASLLKSGLELMEDKKAILVERIKTVVIEQVHNCSEAPRTNFSNLLSERLQYDYGYLANVFSEVTGITIEHFMIVHKIERAKELIVYEELNLTQIAEALHYSSLAHLSNQFKSVTGMTPSFFRKLKQKSRIALEKV